MCIQRHEVIAHTTLFQLHRAEEQRLPVLLQMLRIEIQMGVGVGDALQTLRERQHYLAKRAEGVRKISHCSASFVWRTTMRFSRSTPCARSTGPPSLLNAGHLVHVFA